MTKQVEIIIPTMRRIHAFKAFETLNCIPWPYKLHVITGGVSWADAVNLGLQQTDKKSDIIIMDDDIVLSDETFSKLDSLYDRADIFGFQLIFPDQTVQHAGGYVTEDKQILHMGYKMPMGHPSLEIPYYTCHATTSLVYVKSHAMNDLKGMAVDMPGVSLEDVDFSFRAIKMGFKILYLPEKAVHMESATKKNILNFQTNLNLAVEEIKKRHLDEDKFFNHVRTFPKKLHLAEEAKIDETP